MAAGHWKQKPESNREASILATDRFPHNPDFNQIRFEALAQSESIPPQQVEQANKRFAIRYCNSRPHPTHPTRYHHDKPRIAYIVREANLEVLLPVLKSHNQPGSISSFIPTTPKSLLSGTAFFVRFSKTPAVAHQMLTDEGHLDYHEQPLVHLGPLAPARSAGKLAVHDAVASVTHLDFVVADRNLIPLDERDDWSEHILELPLFAPCEVAHLLPVKKIR